MAGDSSFRHSARTRRSTRCSSARSTGRRARTSSTACRRSSTPTVTCCINAPGPCSPNPFDTIAGRLVGSAMPMIENLYIAERGAAAFSVSVNGTLAYRVAGTAASATLAWFDRQGKRLATVGGTGLYRKPPAFARRAVSRRLQKRCGSAGHLDHRSRAQRAHPVDHSSRGRELSRLVARRLARHLHVEPERARRPLLAGGRRQR